MARGTFIMLSIILLCGCALQLRDNQPSTPRNSAAVQLAQEGIQHLSAGRPDNAIRSFEQAIGLNPNCGQCYYYMAQAWMAKGVKSEARQFNSLARDYLQDNRVWNQRVTTQAQRIESMSR